MAEIPTGNIPQRLGATWTAARLNEEVNSKIRKQLDLSRKAASIIELAGSADGDAREKLRADYNSLYEEQKGVYSQINELRRKQSELPKWEGQGALGQAQGLDELGEVVKQDPASLLEAATGSVAAFGPELLGQAAVGLATGGAGLIGTAARAATMGVSSYRQNEIDRLVSGAQEAGYDLADPAILNKFIRTGTFEDIQGEAQRGAAGRAAVDALSAGVAGRLSGAAAKTGTGQLAAAGRELGEQVALGSGSEIAGQALEKGEVYNPAAVALEGGLELASAPIEILPLALEGRSQGIEQGRADAVAAQKADMDARAQADILTQQQLRDDNVIAAQRRAAQADAEAAANNKNAVAQNVAKTQVISENIDLVKAAQLEEAVGNASPGTSEELRNALGADATSLPVMPNLVMAENTKGINQQRVGELSSQYGAENKFSISGQPVQKSPTKAEIIEQWKAQRSSTPQAPAETQQEIKAPAPTPITATPQQKAQGAIGRMAYQLKRNLVERFTKLRSVAPDIGVKEDAAHSQRDGALREKSLQVQTLMRSLAEDAKAVGSNAEEILSAADELAAMQQIPDWNKEHGEGAYNGITTEQANKRAKELLTRADAPLVHKTADFIRGLHRASLDNLKLAGNIDQELYNTLISKYPNYVSFSSLPTELERLVGKGGRGKFYSLKEFVGGEWERGNTIENAINSFAASENVLYKSKVFNAIQEGIKNNPFMSQFFEVVAEKDLGRGGTMADDIIVASIDGEKSFIRVKDNDLAIELGKLDDEQVNTVLKVFGAFSNLLKTVWVRKNPNTILRQVAMDVQEALVNMESTAISGKRAEYLKNLGQTLAASYRSAFGLKMPAIARKAIANMAKKNGVDVNLDTKSAEMDALMERANKAGIRTGGGYFGKDVQAEIRNKIKSEMARAKNPYLKGILGFLDGVEALVDANDYAVRLSAFKTAVDNGLSDMDAADLARNITANFGRSGKIGAQLEMLYPFFKSSVQGTRRAWKALFQDKKGNFNPRGAFVMVASAIGIEMAIQAMNDALDDDWESLTNPRNNWVFVLGDGTYMQIPKPWGAKPLIELARLSARSMLGKPSADIGADIESLFTTVADSYNPMGVGTVANMIMPAVGDALLAIDSNKDAFGKNIVPDFKGGLMGEDIPSHERYYDSLKNSWFGMAMIDTTKFFNDNGVATPSPAHIDYLARQFGGGVMDFGSKAAGSIAKLLSGEGIDVNDVPVASKFVKFKTAEEQAEASERVGATADVAKVKELEMKGKLDNFYLNKKANEEFARIGKLPLAQQNIVLNQMAQTDRGLAVKVAEKLQEKANAIGTTPVQRAVLKLSQANQVRWHVQKMQEMQDPALQEEYFNELVRTGFIQPSRDRNGAYAQLIRYIQSVKQGQDTTDKAFLERLMAPTRSDYKPIQVQ